MATRWQQSERRLSFVFCQRSSSVIGRLLSKVIFRQRSSSVKGRLLSEVVVCLMSSSVKGHLLSKVVFCQRSSSVKSLLPSKVAFCNFYIWGFSPECGLAELSFSLFVSSSLVFSPECGIAQLSLLLFVSSIWSTWITSIIFKGGTGYPLKNLSIYFVKISSQQNNKKCQQD